MRFCIFLLCLLATTAFAYRITVEDGEHAAPHVDVGKLLVELLKGKADSDEKASVGDTDEAALNLDDGDNVDDGDDVYDGNDMDDDVSMDENSLEEMKGDDDDEDDNNEGGDDVEDDNNEGDDDVEDDNIEGDDDDEEDNDDDMNGMKDGGSDDSGQSAEDLLDMSDNLRLLGKLLAQMKQTEAAEALIKAADIIDAFIDDVMDEEINEADAENKQNITKKAKKLAEEKSDESQIKDEWMKADDSN